MKHMNDHRNKNSMAPGQPLAAAPSPRRGTFRRVSSNHRKPMKSIILCITVLGFWGCTATGDDVRPPKDQFFFPTGMVLSPDSSTLFVSNGNSELRYDSGSVLPISLDTVETMVASWKAGEVPEGCVRDLVLSEALDCDESPAAIGDATVRIGNFSTELALQVLDSGDWRLFATVRGDPSVTWMDVKKTADGNSLESSCGGTGSFQRCTLEHRLSFMREDPLLPTLADEPFGLFVDSQNGYGVVTHLSSGIVTLMQTPTDGSAPILVDELAGLFASRFGVRGAVGVRGRKPGTEHDLIYVTSRSDHKVQMMYVHENPGRDFPALVASEAFYLEDVPPSDDSRGLAFNADGSRAYVINRSPPTMQVLDTSDDEGGIPRNSVTGVIEICGQAANVAVADLGRGERAFVSCFSDGQIWVIDPVGQIVEAMIAVGKGPHAVVIANDRKRMYVGNFLESSVSVVDLEPGSTSEYRTVLRLSKKLAEGGE